MDNNRILLDAVLPEMPAFVEGIRRAPDRGFTLTPEKLSTPETNTEFDGDILPSAGGEVYFREDLALMPQKAYVWQGVTGKNDEEYGKVVITRQYAPGDEITIKPGETLVIDFWPELRGCTVF